MRGLRVVRGRALLKLGTIAIVSLGLRLGLADYLPVTCPLRRLTGIPCASCGLTRAAVALTRGELAVASAYNLAAIPLAFFLAMATALLIWEAVTERAVLRPLWKRCSGVLIWSAVALFLIAWIINLHRHYL